MSNYTIVRISKWKAIWRLLKMAQKWPEATYLNSEGAEYALCRVWRNPGRAGWGE